MPRRSPLASLTALVALAGLVNSGASAQPPPKTEVRAVWVTTAGGLDWPTTTDTRRQQESLRAIARNLQGANINTIFFQVRPRGDAYYASAFEPWAQNLTGTLGKDPGWDPLALLLEEARAAGIEVHAWFNVFKINSGKLPPRTNPLHPARAFPGWCAEVDGETWLDPGNPAVRAYLLQVAMDLVHRYDVQGIHLDFIRYPGRSFPDDESYARHGRGRPRDEWRRSNIDRFVADLYDSVIAVRPRMKVGSAPVGLYENDPASRSEGAPVTVYQNALGWLRAGKQDYLVPQVYWDTGASPGDPDFASVTRGWAAGGGNRHIYAGIGAYKPEVLSELPRQIDIARAAGARGEAFFRYDFVRASALYGGRYTTKALIPPMRWKDPVPPLAPWDLTAAETTPDVFRLDWNPPPPASDGETAARYAVYRSAGGRVDADDARNLVAILPAAATWFMDTVRVHSGISYTYAVTALDRLWNESEASAVAHAKVHRAVALGGFESPAPGLAVAEGEDNTMLVGYRLPAEGRVLLEIEPAGGQPVRLVDTTQAAGMYVVGIAEGRLPPGDYNVTLTAEGKRVVTPLKR